MAGFSEKLELEADVPLPDGVRVSRQHPYLVLVVGDFAGTPAGSVSGPLSEGVVPITADTFDELMAAAAPSVHFTLADPLSQGGAMVEVSLRFDGLRAFDPRQVLLQLPVTRALGEMRQRVTDRLRGKTSPAELSQAVARAASADPALAWLPDALKWSPAAPAAAPDVVDSLLGQLDLAGDGSAPAPAPRTPLGSLVAAAAGGASIPAEEASALRRTLHEIDRRLNVWLNTVLHAPQVQAVEAIWRSLAFLVSHTDFRKGVRLSLLHAPAASLLECVRSRLIDPVFDQGADAPDLIIVDSAFGNSATDLEALDELAQHAASLPAVAIAGVSSGFFGVKHAWQIPTLPAIVGLFDQWQFAKWKSLRAQPYARSLGVVFGRALLRPPYQRDEGTDSEFAFREECITDRDLVWANGPMVAAVNVARSVADTGWPTAMAGYVHGRVDGFAVAQGGPKGDKHFGPSDLLLPTNKIEEMGVAGINAAMGIRDSQGVLLWNGLTAARPQRMDTESLLEVSLPYQLFAGRLSALLFLLKPHLSGLAPEAIPSFVSQHIREWISFDGPALDAVKVQTRPAESDPKALELAVTVTPPNSVLPGAIPVVMGYKLSR
ncbi:MAG: type VI secretion system contractile sheath large subunit [Planctomycetes bacterium]|nr:type VI secretion system contractile sheath large subunit [Planctomycetota bacterium]